jgi:hypothetical protein
LKLWWLWYNGGGTARTRSTKKKKKMIVIPIPLIPKKKSCDLQEETQLKNFPFLKKNMCFPFEISLTWKQIFILRLNLVFGGLSNAKISLMVVFFSCNYHLENRFPTFTDETENFWLQWRFNFDLQWRWQKVISDKIARWKIARSQPCNPVRAFLVFFEVSDE